MTPDRPMREWVGRERVTEDVIALDRARALAASLDQDPAALNAGDVLPHGWHWIYFHDAIRRSALGEDGHERRGDFLPPLPQRRRMWAGGRLRFTGSLAIGATLRRVSRVRSVENKEGRSGPLVFVTVEHTLHSGDEVVLEEEQDLVFVDRRPGPEPAAATRPGSGSAATARPALMPDAEWSEPFAADEVTLFRFSALTFNGHRIHYDRGYATEVEGYPGIVVHGPLLALLLLGAGLRSLGGADDRRDAPTALSFDYRALGPVFANETIALFGTAAPDSGSERSVALWAAHPERGMTTRAELVVR